MTEDGNLVAQATIEEVFVVTDRRWRGIGIIPQSGWRLRDDYQQFDAEKKFDLQQVDTLESCQCRSGEVLRGTLSPTSARLLARRAHRDIHLEQRWFQPKALALRTITTGVSIRSVRACHCEHETRFARINVSTTTARLSAYCAQSRRWWTFIGRTDRTCLLACLWPS